MRREHPDVDPPRGGSSRPRGDNRLGPGKFTQPAEAARPPSCPLPIAAHSKCQPRLVPEHGISPRERGRDLMLLLPCRELPSCFTLPLRVNASKSTSLKHWLYCKELKGHFRDSPAAQRLGLRTSKAGGADSIPGCGIKIPHAVRRIQKKTIKVTLLWRT